MSGHRVGIVGDETLATAIEAAGGDPIVGPPSDREDLRLLVAAGESALVDAATEGFDGPILPVEAGRGVQSVPRDGVEAAVGRVLADEYDTACHPVVSAEGAFTDVTAVFDVALMAAEPARISEFSVRCGGQAVARFRADGVVASTPAGSVGYNRAADGPVVAPETGVVAVVPIAPFATDADRWVLPLEEVTLSVERDETPVELLVDGRQQRAVAAGEPVSLSPAHGLEVARVPESRRFF